METIDLESSIQALSHHESFAYFMFTIKSMREQAISEMSGASTEQIQQISGNILAYDEILEMVNIDDLQRRFG